MKGRMTGIVFLTLFTLTSLSGGSATAQYAAAEDNPRVATDAVSSLSLSRRLQVAPHARSSDAISISVRPATLVGLIGQLAGRRVTVSGARVVGLFSRRVLVIDTATRVSPVPGHRDRVLVLVDRGAIRVPDKLLVGSTVNVAGIARTLLGMQVTGEVPWPTELDRTRLERLEIRAAVLASSVQTPEGVELTDRLDTDASW